MSPSVFSDLSWWRIKRLYSFRKLKVELPMCVSYYSNHDESIGITMVV